MQISKPHFARTTWSDFVHLDLSVLKCMSEAWWILKIFVCPQLLICRLSIIGPSATQLWMLQAIAVKKLYATNAELKDTSQLTAKRTSFQRTNYKCSLRAQQFTTRKTWPASVATTKGTIRTFVHTRHSANLKCSQSGTCKTRTRWCRLRSTRSGLTLTSLTRSLPKWT